MRVLVVAEIRLYREGAALALSRLDDVRGTSTAADAAAAVAAIRRAYRALYRSGLSRDGARQRVAEIATQESEVALLSDFIARSGRGIIR